MFSLIFWFEQNRQNRNVTLTEVVVTKCKGWKQDGDASKSLKPLKSALCVVSRRQLGWRRRPKYKERRNVSLRIVSKWKATKNNTLLYSLHFITTFFFAFQEKKNSCLVHTGRIIYVQLRTATLCQSTAGISTLWRTGFLLVSVVSTKPLYSFPML
jgi:hypothetical protein